MPRTQPSILSRIRRRRQLSLVISTDSSKSNARNLYLEHELNKAICTWQERLGTARHIFPRLHVLLFAFLLRSTFILKVKNLKYDQISPKTVQKSVRKIKYSIIGGVRSLQCAQKIKVVQFEKNCQNLSNVDSKKNIKKSASVSPGVTVPTPFRSNFSFELVPVSPYPKLS